MSDLAEVVYREWKDKIENGLTYEDQEKLIEVCVSIGLPFLELFEMPVKHNIFERSEYTNVR